MQFFVFVHLIQYHTGNSRITAGSPLFDQLSLSLVVLYPGAPYRCGKEDTLNTTEFPLTHAWRCLYGKSFFYIVGSKYLYPSFCLLFSVFSLLGLQNWAPGLTFIVCLDLIFTVEIPIDIYHS